MLEKRPYHPSDHKTSTGQRLRFFQVLPLSRGSETGSRKIPVKRTAVLEKEKVRTTKEDTANYGTWIMKQKARQFEGITSEAGNTCIWG